MEKLKQLEVILIGVNIFGLIGLTWFTIDKFSGITSELETINTTLEAIGAVVFSNKVWYLLDHNFRNVSLNPVWFL